MYLCYPVNRLPSPEDKQAARRERQLHDTGPMTIQ